MRLHKLKANDSSGTYLVESPVTETDILLMARQLAELRLRRASTDLIGGGVQQPTGAAERLRA